MQQDFPRPIDLEIDSEGLTFSSQHSKKMAIQMPRQGIVGNFSTIKTSKTFGEQDPLLQKFRKKKSPLKKPKKRARHSFLFDLTKLQNMDLEEMNETVRIHQFLSIKTKQTKVKQLGKDPFDVLIVEDDDGEKSMSSVERLGWLYLGPLRPVTKFLNFRVITQLWIVQQD